MAEHLRTDYDRMVGESYKDYAARCRGRMLAAEQDRDALVAEVRQLRLERDAWDQRMAALKEEFRKINEVRDRQMARLHAELQGAGERR
jgi:FtsZ-binding cell division protein ZapB